MKELILKYRPYDKSFAFNAIRDAIDGNPQIEENVIYFNDLSTMHKFLTKSRLELLMTIKNEKPESIYDLAHKLKKDQGYISREVKFLKDLGVIDILPAKRDGRDVTVPRSRFDRIIFDVGLGEGLQKVRSTRIG